MTGTRLRIVGSEDRWWPTSTSRAPMDEILEAHRRLRVLARMMINACLSGCIPRKGRYTTQERM